MFRQGKGRHHRLSQRSMKVERQQSAGDQTDQRTELLHQTSHQPFKGKRSEDNKYKDVEDVHQTPRKHDSRALYDPSNSVLNL